MIRLGAPPRRGFLEQRLTREGVKLLRSEIVSAGGFGHAQPPPGSTSLNETFGPAYIQVRKGDRLVPLRWASDLKRLEARLTNPGSWLPASAWKQRKIRAYVPSRFDVCAGAVVVSDLDKPRQGGSCRWVLLASWLCYRRQPRTCSAAGTGVRAR